MSRIFIGAADTPAMAPSFPRGVLRAAGALILFTIVVCAGNRWLGLTQPQADGRKLAELSFAVTDRPDGAVVLRDLASGRTIETATGENGFLRGTLRALARERRMDGIGAQPGFHLTAWDDGRLTLDDLATGRRIDLEAFGSDNLAVFARLLPRKAAQP